MTWFWLALACAFSLATADAVTKYYLSDYSARELALVRSVGAALLLAPLLLLRAIRREPGSRCMLAVAVIYSLSSVIGKKLLAYLPVTVFAPLYYLLVGGGMLLFTARCCSENSSLNSICWPAR